MRKLFLFFLLVYMQFNLISQNVCGSVTPCDIVQNGGFENNSGCGSMPVSISTLASCWLVSSLTPDLFSRNCVQSNPPANLGINTYSSNIVFDSFNGPPNNAIVGVGAYCNSTELEGSESFANYLGSSILNGQVYTLSFWAFQFIGSKADPGYSSNGVFPMQVFNSDSVSAVLSFATNNTFVQAPANVINYPYSPLTTIKSVTLSNSFNTWKHYSITFTASVSSPGNWLYIGMDKNLTFTNLLNEQVPTQGYLFYTLLDDISLRPASQTPQLNTPSQICHGQSVLNLNQYVNVTGGSFSGPGVTSSVVATTNGTVTQYNFNAAQTMPNGFYTISFTYTDNIPCVQTVVKQIEIGNAIDALTIAYTATNCTSAATLSVVSPTPSYNYTWLPGNLPGTTYTINPNALATYTVLASNGSTCNLRGILKVYPATPIAQFYAMPSPACVGNTVTLTAAGNFTSIVWQPGNYTTSVIHVSPLSSTNYTATITNSQGCVASLSTAVIIHNTTPQVSISANHTIVCAGSSTTLTASGNGLYYSWNNSTAATSTNVATPVNTSTYTVMATDANNCSNTATIVITVFKPAIVVNHSSVICAGESVTLAAQSGANSYAWSPGNSYTQIIYVSPTITTTYSVFTTTYPNGSPCSSGNSIQITVNACTGIDSNPVLTHITLFPNPSDGTFTIEGKEHKHLSISIYSESGQLIKAFKLSVDNGYKLVVDDLPSGFYFVEAQGIHTKLVISK